MDEAEKEILASIGVLAGWGDEQWFDLTGADPRTRARPTDDKDHQVRVYTDGSVQQVDGVELQVY